MIKNELITAQAQVFSAHFRTRRQMSVYSRNNFQTNKSYHVLDGMN